MNKLFNPLLSSAAAAGSAAPHGQGGQNAPQRGAATSARFSGVTFVQAYPPLDKKISKQFNMFENVQFA